MQSLRHITPSRCMARSTTTSAVRAFSTTPTLPRQTPTHLTVPVEQVPDYPYGPFYTYKQRNEGLYGTQKVRFGNTVAPKYHRKSPTSWKPNRHTRRLWSVALQGFIRTRMTTQVLKTIDKLGGIDEYLLGSKARRIRELGPAGWRLRWKIMQTPAVRERFNREREALGLPPKPVDEPTVDLPPELAGEGVTPASMTSEIDGMLEREEEFDLGDVSGGDAQAMKKAT
ncbi:hypothetical protein F4780DRAFT_763230 [Xylariomycetidae sp. FL0641]|nr:hypothetical protein F4780DRAFT_763230 [Xylariomycetidae sp. FL0641]